MKRLLLVALLGFVLLPELAYAQKRSKTPQVRLGLTVGAKAGLNFANLANYEANPGYETQTYTSRAGLALGGLVNYRFTQILSVEAGIMYSQRGAKVSSLSRTGGSRTESGIRLNYVELPGVLKFNKKIFYGEVGGAASIFAAGQFQDGKGKKTLETKGNLLDLGYVFGAGVEMPQGYLFSLRYIRSAGTIAKSGTLRSPPGAGEQDLENSIVQVTGGYIFNHSVSRGRRRR